MEMEINEKIVALGVGRRGCQTVGQFDHKIDGVKCAYMRFQAEPESLDLPDDSLKFNVQSVNDCEKIITENFKCASVIFVAGDGPLTTYLAKTSKDLGILTIGIALWYNEELKAMLKDVSDVFISLETEIDLLQNVVESIVNIITKSGFVNLDFDDVKTIFQDVGTAIFGMGRAEGDNRAKIAALQAVNMSKEMKNVKRVLINITTGSEVLLEEMSDATEIIELAIAPDAQIIWGHVVDDDMGSGVQVTFIAGMDDKKGLKRCPMEELN